MKLVEWRVRGGGGGLLLDEGDPARGMGPLRRPFLPQVRSFDGRAGRGYRDQSESAVTRFLRSRSTLS